MAPSLFAARPKNHVEIGFETKIKSERNSWENIFEMHIYEHKWLHCVSFARASNAFLKLLRLINKFEWICFHEFKREGLKMCFWIWYRHWLFKGIHFQSLMNIVFLTARSNLTKSNFSRTLFSSLPIQPAVVLHHGFNRNPDSTLTAVN